MKATVHSGFTIVELLIGIIAAAILALTMGVMLANTYQGWLRSQALADLERDAAVAIHTLDLAVRGAASTVPGEVGVDKLKVVLPSGGIVREFSVATTSGRRSLVYNPDSPGGAGMVIVDRRLGSFVTSVTSGVVRVTMTLVGIDKNDRDTGVSMGVTNLCIRMRNWP